MRAERRGFSGAPDLLIRRMAALALDPTVVADSEPGAFEDLRNRCTKCECPDRCERDLRCDPAGTLWKSYCPNFDLINFMTEMWWLKVMR